MKVAVSAARKVNLDKFKIFIQDSLFGGDMHILVSYVTQWPTPKRITPRGLPAYMGNGPVGESPRGGLVQESSL